MASNSLRARPYPIHYGSWKERWWQLWKMRRDNDTRRGTIFWGQFPNSNSIQGTVCVETPETCERKRFTFISQGEYWYGLTDTWGLNPIYMEVCYWVLLFMPLVILHHLLNVSVQLPNKRGLKKRWICFRQSYVNPGFSSLGQIIFVYAQSKLSLCLPNSALRQEDILRSRCIDPRFLYVGNG
jgi:hypothetical protein